jgi:hypothetical protein
MALTRLLLLTFAWHHASAMSSAAPWKSYLAFNANSGWRGYATIIDPATAVPTLPGIEYSHFVAAEEEDASIRTTTTLGSSGPDAKTVETVQFFAGNIDVDLDGSYSCDHANGLGLAALLLDDATARRVVEHSLAVSDDERRRCLLSYCAETGVLESVLLLVEKKGSNVDIAAHSTLFSLCGTWRGDACSRSPVASKPAKPTNSRGSGGGFGAKRRADGPVGADSPSSSPSALGSVRTAVMKQRLTYAWDGERNVARQLCVTGFGSGDAMDAIRSTGTLSTAEGAYGEYESVRFVGDAALPTLLMLPAACHVIAPLKLPAAEAAASEASFQIEFGAVLEPGESFGWRGYMPSDDEDVEPAEGESELPPLDPEGSSEAQRLVRISRLYSRVGQFASGTTSLCEAE